MARVILVSNRLPWTVSIRDGQGELQASSGGLATALAGTHAKGNTLWIGWPGDLSILPNIERNRILDTLNEGRFIPVELSAQDIERYYEGFSNGVLWPLFHYLLDKVRLDADLDWAAYESVNERFATAVAEHAGAGDQVWVHDYQLMLVPRLLREMRPDLHIGFFLHIPFPAYEVFRILPWCESLLQGLLSADLVGFHTRAYQHHFAECAIGMLGADSTPGGVHYKGRQVRLADYAIGIDADVFSNTASLPLVREKAAKIRQEMGGRYLLLGIDRLDYTKGIPRRFLAFERYLEMYPSMQSKVLLLQVAIPSRQGVEAYALFRKQVDEIAGRINGRFGSPSQVPVHMLHQGLAFEELIALYSAADVMLVTPLRDGMNLVAKEFCATRNDENGVLVLSEFAGAASELKEALLVNPYDIGAVASTIKRALELGSREIGLRMRALRRRVFRGNVHRWAASFLADLEDIGGARDISEFSMLMQRLTQEIERAERIVLMLDYDGTLVPFVDNPSEAMPDEALLQLLKHLSEQPRLDLHLVSGRPLGVLDAWFGGLSLSLHAEHGYWRRQSPRGLWEASQPVNSEWMCDVIPLLKTWEARHPGSQIEQKSAALAWHHRPVPGGLNTRHLRTLREEAAPLLAKYGLELLEGSLVFEFRRKGVQKGMALTSDMGADGTLVIAIGDDRTDEDLFRSLPPSGISIRVGQGPSDASYRVPSIQAVRHLLSELDGVLSGSPTQTGDGL